MNVECCVSLFRVTSYFPFFAALLVHGLGAVEVNLNITIVIVLVDPLIVCVCVHVNLLGTLCLYLLSDPISKLTFFARRLSLCCRSLVVIVLL